jgi:lysophospholipase L1-like esterase
MPPATESLNMNNAVEGPAKRAPWSRLRRLAFNCVVLLASVLACLVLAELGMRLFAPQNLAFFDDTTFRRSAWSLRPNSYHPSYVGVPVRINNLGFRGTDTTTAKPQGVFRIIGVGDSITFGYGVRFEETFLQVLERNLNASATPGTRYEVINAGVAATGLEYYTHFIENVAPTLQPDLILVCMALNDIDPALDPVPREPHARSGLFRSMNGFFLTHSHLYHAIYVQAKSLLYSSGVLKLQSNEGLGFLAIEPPSALQRQAWVATRDYLGRIARLARDRHVRLGVVLFPVEPQLSQDALRLYTERFHMRLGPEVLTGEPQQQLNLIGRENGFPVLDLLPAFRQTDHNQLFLRNRSLSFDPVHPSSLGHRLAGEKIAAFLRSESPDLLGVGASIKQTASFVP